VRDDDAGQDIRLEAHGEHAIRVRAVPSGHQFRDDLVSALVPPPPLFRATDGECPSARVGVGSDEENAAAPPPVLTNGNLKAAVGDDGKITFTRVSDGKVLLSEQVSEAHWMGGTTVGAQRRVSGGGIPPYKLRRAQ
jgi:hypothetical protein